MKYSESPTRRLPWIDDKIPPTEMVGLPYKDKKLFSQYSLGMKQRLAIALAVMHDPELLILDEPINGLDPIGIAEVRSFIRELCDARGKTILLQLSKAFFFQQRAVVDNSNIVSQQRNLRKNVTGTQFP